MAARPLWFRQLREASGAKAARLASAAGCSRQGIPCAARAMESGDDFLGTIAADAFAAALQPGTARGGFGSVVAASWPKAIGFGWGVFPLL